MRPIEKWIIGQKVTLSDGESYTIDSDYPYKSAKPYLVENIGPYCSYCECVYHQVRDLQVEHIQPKKFKLCGVKPYAHLENKWDNFLLSCATCNGADNKDTKNVVLGNIHLPHLNNTFMSLIYKAGGVVEVNPQLTGVSYVHAEALLKLVGLDKTPQTSNPGDKRCYKRRIDWDKAQKYIDKYKKDKADVDTIIDLVKSCGGWSIWYTVFRGEDEVRRALLEFPGTATQCFDPSNHYEPIFRNPTNNVDPV